MGLFLGAIATATDDYAIFISASSFIMVFGGTMAAAFISYEPRYVMLSFKVMFKIFMSPGIGRGVLKAEVGRIIKWAYIVQKNGIPALETEAKKATRGDKFLKFGVDMVISGYSGEEVRECMNNTIETSFGRNTVLVDIIKKMGAAAPAFGMIGTLIGLVQMLSNLKSPEDIGGGMATALLTTFYGALIANLVCIPLAGKLGIRSNKEGMLSEMTLQGLLAVVRGDSPTSVREKMQAFISAQKREELKPTV